MDFFSSKSYYKPLTRLDVLDKELERLHKEIARYTWSDEIKETSDIFKSYNKLLDQIAIVTKMVDAGEQE